jgi:hypothetical protein
MQNIGKESFEELSSEEYLERLKEGLTVIETIDKILCYLVQCTSTVRDKLLILMKLYGVKCRDI